MSPTLEETITLDFVTTNAGSAADADSTPTCKVFEDAVTTAILTPTVTKRGSETGNYYVQIPCTAANGFEAAKSYNVHALATVGGIATRDVIGTFQMRAKNTDDLSTRIPAALGTNGNMKADLQDSLGVAVTNYDGVAQAGASSSITLASSASSVTDFYKGQVVWLVGGTGSGQRRLITAYNGATKVATVHRVWDTTPDATSQYVFEAGEVDLQTVKWQTVVCTATVTIPSGTLASTTNITAASGCVVSAMNNNVITAGAIDPTADAEIAAAVWDLATTGHTTSGTFGAAAVAAGSASDPWTTVLPASYASNTAGFRIGTYLDAAISGRLAPAVPGRTLSVDTSGNASAVLANAAHGGPAMSVTFASLTGSATLSNTPCVSFTGNGTGAGLEVFSVAGPGLYAHSTSNIGGYFQSAASAGLKGEGGGTGAGILGTGGLSGGHGVQATRGTSGADDLFLTNSDAPTLNATVTGSAFAAATNTAIADAMLGRNLAGGSDGGRTVKDALRSLRNKIAFDVPSVGQFTVFDETDGVAAWTGTYTRSGTSVNALTITDPA